MLRKVSMAATLIAVALWLVLSYWPAAAAVLPLIAFGPGLPVFWLVTAVLAVTAAIQAWLVVATVQPLAKPADATQAAALHHFNLRVGAEGLLTAAPLVITLALAAFIALAAS